MSKESINDVHKSIGELIRILKNLKEVYGFDWLGVEMTEEELNINISKIESFVNSTIEVKNNYNNLYRDLWDIINSYDYENNDDE